VSTTVLFWSVVDECLFPAATDGAVALPRLRPRHWPHKVKSKIGGPFLPPEQGRGWEIGGWASPLIVTGDRGVDGAAQGSGWPGAGEFVYLFHPTREMVMMMMQKRRDSESV
jgi:hypothetical protein